MAAARIADLLRLRLIAQGLEGEPERSPEGVVRRMLAVQAQDFGAACWALGVRSPGSTSAQIIAALDDGRIVRSWPMRGTLHFVLPEDLRWMLSLTAERMVNGLTLRHRQLELGSAHIAEAEAVVTTALAGGKCIDRGSARLSPQLLSGTDRGVVLGSVAQDPAVARASGRMGTCRQRTGTLAELADRTPEHPRTVSQKIAVHLLPAFDEYLLGYHNRDPVLDPRYAEACRAETASSPQ